MKELSGIRVDDMLQGRGGSGDYVDGKGGAAKLVMASHSLFLVPFVLHRAMTRPPQCILNCAHGRQVGRLVLAHFFLSLLLPFSTFLSLPHSFFQGAHFHQAGMLRC